MNCEVANDAAKFSAPANRQGTNKTNEGLTGKKIAAELSLFTFHQESLHARKRKSTLCCNAVACKTNWHQLWAMIHS
jgi:hypothetical protein